jgi:GntR family transcriptional regulator, transcriptional repressor for pyruvate dehydrogenase complex
MTEQSPVHPPAISDDKRESRGPARRQVKGLTHDLVEALQRQIATQAIRAGDKLPSESEIMQTFGVSRGVVREALSRLQAAGLVQTHHGVGTFALEVRDPGVFVVNRPSIRTLPDMLDVLELRASVEAEAAAFAAARRSDEQLKAMRRALDDFDSHVSVAGDTVSPDFRFHREIAHATGNQYFVDLVSQLGLAVIPRTRVSASWLDVDHRAQHLHHVNGEHENIYLAIARRDPASASACMRIHLLNSRERQRHAHQQTGVSALPSVADHA